MDTLTPEQRRANMSKIRGSDTKPEEIVRKFLFAKGLRYRKNDRRLPGKPDIVLPRYKTVVFVNGCFWHWHKGCKDFYLPRTRREFWIAKLAGNVKRDELNYRALLDDGWNVLIVWECELKKSTREQRLNELFHEIVEETHL